MRLDVGVAVNGVEPFAEFLFIRHTLAQQTGPADDGIERRPQLMRDHGDEFVLQLVCVRGLAVCGAFGGEGFLQRVLGLLRDL